MALDPATPLVQLVLLRPVAAAAAADSDSSAAVPELAPLCARLRSLHPGARLRIAHVAYTDGLLALGSTGAWRDEGTAALPHDEPLEDTCMHLDGAQGSAVAKAHVLTGLGAAIEKLAPAPEAYSPMLPAPPSVVARLIVHLAAPLSLSFEPVPRAGFSSSHPWDISSVAAALKEHSIHFSTLLRPAAGDGSFDDARKLHTSVSAAEDMPAADVAALLSSPASGNALLRGFAPSRSGVPPAAAPAPVPAPPAAGAAPNKMSLPASIVQDPQARVALQKLMFVQQHFQNIAKSANAALEAMSAAGNPDPERRKGLEKIKSDVRTALEQVHAQAKIVTTGAAIPDSNMFFGLLSVLHRDAELCKIPSGVSEAVLKISRQAAEAAKVQMQQAAGSAAAKPAAGTAPGPVPGASQAPTAPQQAPAASGPAAVWSGSICWTITDGTGTKREVSTIVSANVSAKTPKDALVLPWPARLTIAQVSGLDLASLHSYVAAHQVPAILFATKQAVPGEPALPLANERIYTTLANMLRERKSCAYIPHGAPGAGIVLVATPVSASGTPPPPRLLGLVFKNEVPLAQMAQVAQQRAQAAQQAQAAAAAGATTTSVAPPPPPAAAPLSISVPSAAQSATSLGSAPGSAAPPQALFQAQATPAAPTQPVSLQQAQQFAMQRQLAANLMRQRAGAAGAGAGMSSPTAANNPMQQAQALAHTQFMHAQAQQAAQAVARQMQAQQMRPGQPQAPLGQPQQQQQQASQAPPAPPPQQQLWSHLGGFDMSQASAPQPPVLNAAFLNAFSFNPNAAQPQLQMPGMGQANMGQPGGGQGWNIPGSAGMSNMGGAPGAGGISAAEAAALAQQLGLSSDALKQPPQQGQMQGGIGGMMMPQQPVGAPMAQQPNWGAPGAFGNTPNLSDPNNDFALLQQMLNTSQPR